MNDALADAGATRLRELYDALVDLDPVARRARIDALDVPPALRARLEALLAAPPGRAPLLDVPVVAAIDRLRDDEAFVRRLLGSDVGPFRLVALLGEGGSATVFRAERPAGEGTQVVALKLLRTGLASSDAQRRFRREQSILAQLTHPNIARLVEAGLSEAGTPFIAMEFVDGVPITEDAAARALGLRARLETFVTLCRAVEAAHQALVVHRDLKPSNVFVDRDGAVKVLDFGIAKLVEGEEDATTTRTQSLVLTPEYAAPEQFTPGPVTTAADVYALGVLLGELLTGLRLNAGAWRRASAAVAGARDAPAGLPDPRTLARMLRGDLDAIVATATAEEPGQRYRSAGALAEDIERHLSGKAVTAHPPTRWYRARKFVARHRGGVAVTALLGLGILVSLAFAMLETRRASREAELARATRDFLVDVFRTVEPAGPSAPPPTVVDVVEAASRRVDAERLNPRVRLDLKTQLGVVLRRQSRVEPAIAVLQDAAEGGAARFGDADGMVFEARTELGEALVAGGRLDDADALLAAMAGVAPRQDRRRRVDYELLGLNIDVKRGRVEGALERAERAEALCRSGCDDSTSLAVLSSKGVVLTDLGRHGDAAAAFERGMVLARAIHGETHVEVATVLNNLSGAYRRLGRLDDAKRLALEVAAIDDAVLPAVHWRRSIHLNYLGNAHLALGEDVAALDAFERAVAVSRAVSGDEDPSLALDFVNIGVLQGRLGRADEAIATFEDAVRRAEAGYGADNRLTARVRATYAFNRALLGDAAGAAPLMERSLADLRGGGEATRAFLFDALRQQARIRLLAGDATGSLAAIGEADALLPALGDAIAEARLLLLELVRAAAFEASGRRDDARTAYEATLARLVTLASDDYGIAEAQFALGRYAAHDDCAQARSRLEAGRATLAERAFVYAYLRELETALEAAIAGSCTQPSR